MSTDTLKFLPPTNASAASETVAATGVAAPSAACDTPTCARDSETPRNVTWAQQIISIGIHNSEYFLGPKNGSWGVEIARGARRPSRRPRRRRSGAAQGRCRAAAQARNRRFELLSAMRAHTKAPYKSDLLWKALRALNPDREGVKGVKGA